jgi:hypothetical protein
MQLADPETVTRQQIEETIADFGGADLRGISFAGKFLEGVEFDGSDLREVDFTRAFCRKALFHNADLRGANLTGADFSEADVQGVVFDKKIKCRGMRITNSYGSPKFKRFAEHQDFIEEFKSKKSNLPIYYLWMALSDCGRSLGRWALWSITFSFLFGVLFWGIGLESFEINKSLKCNSNDFFIMLYYSVVTFTTLGFGDITPITTGAATAVICEVVTGYVMLGGLISIFSNKLVER